MDAKDNIYQDTSEDTGSNESYKPQHEKTVEDNLSVNSYSDLNGSQNVQPQNTGFGQQNYPHTHNNGYNQPGYNQQPNSGYGQQQGYYHTQQGGYGQQNYQQPNNNIYDQQGYYNAQNNNYGQHRSYSDQPRKPVYDRFMFEPIGFEELERNQANASSADEAAAKQRSKNERNIVRIFALLVAISAFISIFGIVFDIINSKGIIDKIGRQNQVILYKESKPKGATDIENFKDENGRYTPEGAAALVKPSIVKIYTYSNYSDYAAKRAVGTGSGIVLNEDGYIATNAHVLEAEGYHRIETMDGEYYEAKLVGRDTKTDIAVIKVTAPDLTPATLGDSDEAVVGETVIAIGNPANLAGTVTDGIISAVDRKIRSDSTGFEMTCLQTNAEISPGNSGGALVNMYGQVIGITSSKYVSSDLEGLGFAITINEATPVIEDLIKNGFVPGRFRIGIHLLDMSSTAKKDAIEERIGMTLPDDFKGIYIDEIDEDCDIAKTELKSGDFIVAINGKSVSTYDELYETISSQYEAGDKVPATCANIDKNGDVSYYEIEFKLMEDTSGNY
ncbi:trypsin-like peptidase domain-containing protein [Ruminococcus sp.]|uniref:trypsin-like peptidase domain-containing protein n=1 Tax=Ruminococcus sp. TaxID=41978 RepID=UPI001B7C49F5|nr:trypsin-like peptidase domain-containing protein [Ruminococcus sp.]MBP5431717.1 trypsin-like peptidase domain-containing protein [Ruminococcus sp.]